MRSVQNLLSELAYVTRSMEYLGDVLSDIEAVAERLGRRQGDDPLLEGMVEHETNVWSAAMKHQCDAATRTAEAWRERMEGLET
ncbi:hypothetical protein ELQ87_33480 [Streptomyces griseoviridis]|uniref:WXG100 family type VII secretion target n=1 Tax=Streptomyces griseoviridis TaxID=45398 RepID=A0A3Q9L042_STRGD|nr:hypothetical protein [Streptomyces griseoviridis]AZS88606.1 hypothetical protein ELQ87_33480 [Streptomyces griseoviridis]QCN84552.1 hypothetical protein DDJ31_05785 [Streptomyces griseoviridis]